LSPDSARTRLVEILEHRFERQQIVRLVVDEQDIDAIPVRHVSPTFEMTAAGQIRPDLGRASESYPPALHRSRRCGIDGSLGFVGVLNDQ
jgi:hypothetical protein